MTARPLMNPDPVARRPTDTVAAALILQHHLRHPPVVDERGRYAGASVMLLSIVISMVYLY